ncbi:hypothetical protein Ciccas_013150 [Cichlidogyrus casuarinus]|uniref:Phosphotransferase n=1 Tax=Cichlidogyrus casuarinus TaxID=1844966 RepID=A0ABD2PME7_9PLAT
MSEQEKIGFPRISRRDSENLNSKEDHTRLKYIFTDEEYQKYPILRKISLYYKCIWKDKKKVLDIISHEMDISLKGGQGSLAMLNTFTSPLQDDSKTMQDGEFLSIDLGGTNYRVYYLKFYKRRLVQSLSEIYKIPSNVLRGTSKMLFEILAESVRVFLLDNHLDPKKHYNVGWVFSFPCRQLALNQSYLLKWTKNFKIRRMENVELAEALTEALKLKCLNMTVRAIVNDTVGTLFSVAVDQPDCAIGLIVGTGTNACYIEQSKNMIGGHKLDDELVIINTEWGALGENRSLDRYRNKFDFQLDEASLYPGQQIFEKMCSSRYLGELLRLTLIYLVKQNIILDGKMPDR